MGRYGRFRRAEIGRKSAITAITKNHAITSARFTESEPDLSAIAGPTRHILAVDRLPRLFIVNDDVLCAATSRVTTNVWLLSIAHMFAIGG
jgi:hypothetical protein